MSLASCFGPHEGPRVPSNARTSAALEPLPQHRPSQQARPEATEDELGPRLPLLQDYVRIR